MSISLYKASVPAFLQKLTSLSAILDKAEAFAAERKIDPAVVLGWRLAPDMFALTRQVQIATDLPKGCCARLAGVEVPKWPTRKRASPTCARVSRARSTSCSASSPLTSTAPSSATSG
jgi:hypothetical protein